MNGQKKNKNNNCEYYIKVGDDNWLPATKGQIELITMAFNFKKRKIDPTDQKKKDHTGTFDYDGETHTIRMNISSKYGKDFIINNKTGTKREILIVPLPTISILVQGNMPHEWWPPFPEQEEIIRKALNDRVKYAESGRFSYTTKGKIYNVQMNGSHNGGDIYLIRKSTEKKRRVIVTKLPNHNGAGN